MWVLPYVSAFSGLASLLLFVLAAISPAVKDDSRLAATMRQVGPVGEIPGPPGEEPWETLDRASSISRLTRNLPWLEALQIQLLRAGWVLRPSEYIAFSSLAALILAGVLMLLTNWVWIVFPGLLVGYAGSWLLLKSRQASRNRALSAQLPDTLDMLCSSLRAGFSVAQGMNRIQAQTGPPIAEEFRRSLEEIRFGRSLSAALETMVVRTANYDLALVVSAIQTQLEIGGNMAEVLEKIATMIRERVKLKGEVSIAAAEGRLSAAILVAMPFVMGLAIRAMNPSYLEPLTGSAEGRILLIVAAVLMIVGAWILSKLTAIEV
jgi:tight adherence protein B